MFCFLELSTVTTTGYVLILVYTTAVVQIGLAQITVTRALTQGTSRYSTTLGLIMASNAAGAALSNLIASYVVHLTSYHAGFVFLGCVAFIPLALLMFLRVPRVHRVYTIYHAALATCALRAQSHPVLRPEGALEFATSTALANLRVWPCLPGCSK